ncbi:MAG: MBL fold metallo-hydrolase [Acidimicrobiales bacterium]
MGAVPGDRGKSTAEPMVVSFLGVRGSTPCSCPTLARYGGNTSCVAVESPGHDPIVFDLGTGLRQWGRALGSSTAMTIHALVSHLHWDHVQGLPFFAPLFCPDTTLAVYGPPDGEESFAGSFGRFMKPPFVPIEASQLPGEVVFRDLVSAEIGIAGARVRARSVPHVGATNGYRVERGGVSVAYVSDHQEPIGRPDHVDDVVLELCADVDLLIHDAQFTPGELEARRDWGHCTVDYAIEVARQAAARRLVLFHHDPARDDDELDRVAGRAAERGRAVGLASVLVAAEGMKITLGTGID